MESLYTEAGLIKLAKIVRHSRGDRSFREFERLTNISHAVIRRLEIVEVKNPDDSTLSKLAPLTPFSFEELKAIAQERQQGEIRKYRVAEDLLPIVNQLPYSEMARLGQMIIAKLARLLTDGDIEP